MSVPAASLEENEMTSGTRFRAEFRAGVVGREVGSLLDWPELRVVFGDEGERLVASSLTAANQACSSSLGLGLGSGRSPCLFEHDV